MFTGIIEDLGTVAAVDALASGKRLTLETALDTGELVEGESIAVNGACMTVIEIGARRFSVDVSAESLRRTTLGRLGVGDPVNLERSVRLEDRLGGHLVSGHVDGTGDLVGVRAEGESSLFTFAISCEMMSLCVEKGSIAIDGISLTCFNLREDEFDVAVIPHTLKMTTLGVRVAGDQVNVENDLLGKYVARLLDPALRARGAETD